MTVYWMFAWHEAMRTVWPAALIVQPIRGGACIRAEFGKTSGDNRMASNDMKRTFVHGLYGISVA